MIWRYAGPGISLLGGIALQVGGWTNEEVVTQIFQRIAGGRLGNLKLGESFAAANVVPEINGEAISLDSVSGG